MMYFQQAGSLSTIVGHALMPRDRLVSLSSGRDEVGQRYWFQP